MKHFQELVDEYYEYLCERLEKEIDKEIIRRGYASKEWFQKFIFEEFHFCRVAPLRIFRLRAG